MNLIKYFFYSFISALLFLFIIDFLLGINYKFIDSKARDLSLESSITHPNADLETINFTRELVNYRDYKYKSFIGWKGPVLNGEYIKTDKQGRRFTLQSANNFSEHTIHLFGGSTMWGYGVSDSNTIPSILSSKFNFPAINYGEQAYNSRQELNLLIENLDSIKPGDFVVFYDGVNDVFHNCKSINSVNGHAREYYFKSILETDFEDVSLYMKAIYESNLFRLVNSLLGQDVSNTSNEVIYSSNVCGDLNIAAQVSNFLVNSWQVMSLIVKDKGATPLCILQPNPYTLKSDPFAQYPPYRDQINTLYPLVRSQADRLDCFLDYSEKLEHDFYTDSCCHLNREGNAQIAEELSIDLRNMLMSK